VSPPTLIASIGVALLLLAFLLNLVKRLSSDGSLYSFLNFVGAALAAYASYLIDFMPFVVLEGTWALAAGVSLGRILFARPPE
jgi:hypothetical protein